MRIEAITIYKSQKAAAVSLPFPRPRYLKYHEYITCSAQAKIMIAKKMGMTIGGTSQAVMVLYPAEFYDQVAAATRLYG
jgi:hypothetical protein